VAVRWTENWPKSCTQKSIIRHRKSRWKPITGGVSQGWCYVLTV